MPAISSYYAQVGVLLDDKSIRKVQAYLSSIERPFNAFQKRLEAKAPISVRVKIDRTRSAMQLQRDLTALGRLSHIQVNNVRFNRLAVQKNLQQVLQMAPGQSRIRIGALLSQSSLQAMQQQIRTSISAVVVSPRINPIVNQGVTRGGRGVFAPIVGGGRGGRRGENPNGLSRDIRKVDPFGRSDRRHFSPWYNPLMLGGSLGAFQRFGLFSLPLVAGSFGINAITNRAEALQNVPLQLAANTGSRQEGQQAFNFLTNLGGQLGFRVQDTAAAYGRMVSNSRGTGLDPQKAFTDFMQFSAVSGLAGEEQKRGLIAIEQMISARQVRQQEINQLNNAGLGVVTEILAESVAGGDVGKLRDMMKKGQVGVPAIQKMLDEMGRRAKPFLADFYKTIGRNRRVAQNATEQWFESFMSGNVTKSIADFYKMWAQSFRGGLDFAQRLGFAFAAAVDYATAAFLAVQETIAWLENDAGEGNFLVALFGKPTESEFLSTMRTTFSELQSIAISVLDNISKSVDQATSGFSALLSTITTALKGMNALLNLLSGYSSAGIPGLSYANKQNAARAQAEQQADAEADKVLREHGIKLPTSAILRRREDIYNSIMAQVPKPKPLADQLADNGMKSPLDLMGQIDNAIGTPGDNSTRITRNITRFSASNMGIPFFGSGFGLLTDIVNALAPKGASLVDITRAAQGSSNSPFIWNTAQVPSNGPTPFGLPPLAPQGPQTINIILSGKLDLENSEDSVIQFSEAARDTANEAITNSLKSFFPATAVLAQ